MRVVLVQHGDVVIDILLLGNHPAQAVVHDHRQLVGESRIVRNAVWNLRRPHVRVAVFVLQALAVQRGTPRGAAEQEAARARIARRPPQVAGALHTEHRIKDEERNHRHAVGRVRRRRRDPRAQGAGLVDAFLQNLAVLVFLVEHELVAVLRRVELADRRPDADLAE